MPIGFAAVDWGIVGIYVLFAAVPGFLCRKYIRGQADFLIAGRTLSIFLATATLTATELGLITVMYWAEFGYVNGFSAMVMGVIAFVATLFVGLTGFMVKGLRASGATTVASYYEIRYSRGVRILGGLIVAAAGVLNYGVFLRIEAEFVRIITGIPDLEIHAVYADTPRGPSADLFSAPDTAPALAAADAAPVSSTALAMSEASSPASASKPPLTIPSVNLVMSVLLIVVLSYTLLGGMVSVVLTDYIQFIVLTAGLAATTWWVMVHPDVGGFAGMVQAVVQHRPGYGFNPFLTGTNVAGAAVGLGALWVIWQLMHWLGTNTWQPGAFRTAAADSPRTARIMWTLTAFNYFGRGVIPMLWGVGALAFISHTMGPGEIARLDQTKQTMQAMPMLLSHLPTGLVGLVMAGMLAALMSTHSSYLLTWSGVLTEDLIAPIAYLTGWEVPHTWRLWITRALIVVLGAFLLLYGLWFKVPQTIWGYLAVTGTMYVAGAMSVLAFGLYWKRATVWGAYLGLLGGALPGLVYLFLNITVLLGQTQGFAVSPSIVGASKWMTDPVTGVLSFLLAPVGMIVGSLIGGGTVSVTPVPRPEPVPALTGAARLEGES